MLYSEIKAEAAFWVSRRQEFQFIYLIRLGMIKLPVVVKSVTVRETITNRRLRLRLRLKMSMEIQTQTQSDKVYAHYNHTDSCKYSRWNARESYEYMHAKPWQQIVDFYSNVVNGKLSISSLFLFATKEFSELTRVQDDAEILELSDETRKSSSRRWARVTYKILLAYHGSSFDGWQKQPHLNTVQGVVEQSLGSFVDERKAELLKSKGLPLEGCVVVAGRTDKGVTALQQVCAFSTWRTDVTGQDIEDAINNSAPGKLRLISVFQVSRVFHPNFCAKWRRYLYIFPFSDKEEWAETQSSPREANVENINKTSKVYKFERDDPASEDITEEYELDCETKPTEFSIIRVDQLLRKLEGKLLSYKMFARDTKASRNIGPATECFVYHARATEARLPFLDKDSGEGIKVMCVELVANRFLRKMVRVLVATSIREAAAGAEDDALLKLMDATCRRATAPPAPPDGLCLVDVGYTEFEPQICFIS